MKEYLIPMTDYVLETHDDLDDYAANRMKRCLNYAKFLKQPPELGQFVPVDEEGNVLEPVLKSDYGLDAPEFNTYKYPIECYGNDLEEYQKALDKVLFKNCTCEKIKSTLDYYYIVKHNNANIWVSWNKSKTIEDLIPHNLELTGNHLK